MNGPIHDGCMERDCCPVTPLRKTPAVVRGDHKPRCCEHGEWTFAGTDYKRKATKWRCPTGECTPASVWVKANRRIACTRLFRATRSGRASSTAAVEPSSASSDGSSTNGPCCRCASRGIERVRLHPDLTILAKLGCALAAARA